MDKSFLVDQLREKLHLSARTAIKASEGAAETVSASGGANRLRAANLAQGQAKRAESSFHGVALLDSFRPAPFARNTRIAMGALVEVENESQGRTFFLAPVGAGIELTGPGGEGFFTVVTPQSPIGKAVLGRKVGDEIEVEMGDDTHAWQIGWVG